MITDVDGIVDLLECAGKEDRHLVSGITLDQLGAVLSALHEYKDAAPAMSSIHRLAFWRGLGRMIADDWKLDSPLTSAILALVQKAKRGC